MHLFLGHEYITTSTYPTCHIMQRNSTIKISNICISYTPCSTKMKKYTTLFSRYKTHIQKSLSNTVCSTEPPYIAIL